MYLIGAIAASPGAGLASLGDQLPWAWFGLMAIADVALVVVVVGRRRSRPLLVSSPSPRPARPEVFVVRSGWRVPRSRALRMRPHQAAYAWPLHSEYMVSRLT
jgi:hypothetical protein